MGFKAILNKNKLGKGLTCVIALDLERYNKRKVFSSVEESLKKLSEIENIYLVTGRYDYFIIVNLRDVEDLREFVVRKLTNIEFINKVETFVAISSVSNSGFRLLNTK